MQYYESFMLFLIQTNAQSDRACIYNNIAVEILVHSEAFLIQMEEIYTEYVNNLADGTGNHFFRLQICKDSRILIGVLELTRLNRNTSIK